MTKCIYICHCRPDSPAVSFLRNETHGWYVIPCHFLEMVGPCTRAACPLQRPLCLRLLAIKRVYARHHQLPPTKSKLSSFTVELLPPPRTDEKSIMHHYANS